MSGAVAAVVTYGRMIKFSHSIFALPFALSGALLAARGSGITAGQIGWIVLAMVVARSAAMGFNRLADRNLDAANPRTRGRELPAGLVSPNAVVALVAGSSALLIFAASQLNPLCLYLAPAVLLVLLGYSLTKRFTWLSHVVLGACLGGAPLGAWIAVAGEFALVPIVLGLAVVTWVAGFDIIYACQDAEFDREAGLHSIPARFGIGLALFVARGLHVVAVGVMVLVGQMAGLGVVYMAGVVVVAGLLLWEHRLVRADDLSRLDMAFFTMNGIISVVFFGFLAGDVFLVGEGVGVRW